MTTNEIDDKPIESNLLDLNDDILLQVVWNIFLNFLLKTHHRK